MAKSITIQVSTELLQQKASSVRSLAAQMRQACEDMSRLTAGMSGYWLGDASGNMRRQYEEKKPVMEEMLKRLGEYPDDLERMAGIYQTAETENIETSAPLEADVIR